jgi:hypothetical protein
MIDEMEDDFSGAVDYPEGSDLSQLLTRNCRVLYELKTE